MGLSVIVAAKSYSGFAGYLGAVPIDWGPMGGFTAFRRTP